MVTTRAAARGDAAYPDRLEVLGLGAPRMVYLRGAPWSPSPPAVGVVGARRASEAGRAWARALGRVLADAGVAVISGGALGIDAAAHEGALDRGGRTCVVLPTPADAPGPQRNLPLFERVLAGGGTLLSEYERQLGRRGFSERNRLIAALADGVVVVEARARSGTRHTAAAAVGIGRRLLTKRWGRADPRGEGARVFARWGAESVDTPEDVLLALGAAPHRGKVDPDSAPRENADDPLWAALEQPTTVDALAARLGRQADTLTLELLRLELEGRVVASGGRWRRA